MEITKLRSLQKTEAFFSMRIDEITARMRAISGGIMSAECSAEAAEAGKVRFPDGKMTIRPENRVIRSGKWTI